MAIVEVISLTSGLHRIEIDMVILVSMYRPMRSVHSAHFRHQLTSRLTIYTYLRLELSLAPFSPHSAYKFYDLIVYS
jgi:hypothetical protein